MTQRGICPRELCLALSEREGVDLEGYVRGFMSYLHIFLDILFIGCFRCFLLVCVLIIDFDVSCLMSVLDCKFCPLSIFSISFCSAFMSNKRIY